MSAKVCILHKSFRKLKNKIYTVYHHHGLISIDINFPRILVFFISKCKLITKSMTQSKKLKCWMCTIVNMIWIPIWILLAMLSQIIFLHYYIFLTKCYEFFESLQMWELVLKSNLMLESKTLIGPVIFTGLLNYTRRITIVCWAAATTGNQLKQQQIFLNSCVFKLETFEEVFQLICGGFRPRRENEIL